MADAGRTNAEGSEPLETLMVQYQAGDYDAFETLHAALAPRLRRYLLGLARDPSWADDLLQDTFVQLHKARHTFNPDLRVAPWAYGIARHAFLMGRRTRSRRGEMNEVAVEDTAPSRGPTPEDRVVMQSDVGRGLSALAPGVRLTILLHDLVGLDFADIASRLGIGSSAARLRASRGRAAARRAINGGDGDGR